MVVFCLYFPVMFSYNSIVHAMTLYMLSLTEITHNPNLFNDIK